jgi:hypothetical protein
MAAPQTRRQFGPEAQARRARKADQAARMKAAAQQAAVDVWSPHASETSRDVLDVATEEALATAGHRAELRAATAARDPRAMQEAQRKLAERKAELRQSQAAAQPQRRRPTVREWLERMSVEERENIEQTETFARLSVRAQAHVLRVRDDVDRIDARAETLLAQEREDEWLAEQEDASDLYEDHDEGDLEERLGELRADQLETESETAFAAWAEPMSAEEALGIVEPGTGEPSLSEQVGWEDEE